MAAGYEDEFVLRGHDAGTGQVLGLRYLTGGEPVTALPLTTATARDASDIRPGWVSWEVAMELGPSGSHTLRAALGGGSDHIEITVKFG